MGASFPVSEVPSRPLEGITSCSFASSTSTGSRNVIDSDAIPAEADVTCLVGKSESGKTALLQALELLNPARAAEFEIEEQYPRRLLVRDRKDGEIDATAPISATFEFEEDDRAAVEETFGGGVIKTETIEVSRTYAGGRLAYRRQPAT